MAIAYDNSSIGDDNTNTASSTLAHTCSGSNRLLLVWVVQDRNSVDPTVTGVTYNGVAMTQVNQGSTDFSVRTSLWRLIAPATGSNNVVVSYSATQTQNRTIFAISYTGVDQTTPLDAETTEGDATNNVSAINLTYTAAVAGDLVVDFFGFRGSGVVTPTVDGSQTQRANRGNSTITTGCSEEVGAASVSMDWSISGSSAANRQTAVGINPVAGTSSMLLQMQHNN